MQTTERQEPHFKDLYKFLETNQRLFLPIKYALLHGFRVIAEAGYLQKPSIYDPVKKIECLELVSDISFNLSGGELKIFIFSQVCIYEGELPSEEELKRNSKKETRTGTTYKEFFRLAEKLLKSEKKGQDLKERMRVILKELSQYDHLVRN